MKRSRHNLDFKRRMKNKGQFAAFNVRTKKAIKAAKTNTYISPPLQWQAQCLKDFNSFKSPRIRFSRVAETAVEPHFPAPSQLQHGLLLQFTNVRPQSHHKAFILVLLLHSIGIRRGFYDDRLLHAMAFTYRSSNPTLRPDQVLIQVHRSLCALYTVS
jgi:hypothetical protein